MEIRLILHCKIQGFNDPEKKKAFENIFSVALFLRVLNYVEKHGKKKC